MPGEVGASYASQTVYPLAFLSSSPILSRDPLNLDPEGWSLSGGLSPPSSRKDSGGASSSNASSDSSPPSPGSCKAERETSSFIDVVPFPYPPRRNVFIEPGSGMRDVPMWLKSLRLHKYTSLFQQISYDEMLALDEATLEAQGVTKGARHKIVVCVAKLKDRSRVLKALDKEAGEVGNIRSTLGELKAIIVTPIRPFPPPGRPEPYQSRIDGIDVPAEELDDENLPAHFTRVLGKLATAIFASLGTSLPEAAAGDDLFPNLLHVLDRVLNHEAFTQAQKRRVLNWKQVVKRVWHPIRRPSFGHPGSPTTPGYPGFRTSPWHAGKGVGGCRPGDRAQQVPPPPPVSSRPRWNPGQPPAAAQGAAPRTFDPYASYKAKQAYAGWHQLQAVLGYLASQQGQDKTACYDKATPPPFRSFQEMASALAAYGGLFQGSFPAAPGPAQPPTIPCNGNCQAPTPTHTNTTPHLSPPLPRQPPVHDWSNEARRGGAPWPITTAEDRFHAPKPTLNPPQPGSEWERAASPKAFHFPSSWNANEPSTLSSRMENLCRSVAEVALVEQISAAAAGKPTTTTTHARF